MSKDINKSVFDEATKLKLDIFGECFEEWLPVFSNDLYTKAVYVFDFFAGSGKDVKANLGSPLVLLNKAKGKDRKYCLNAKKEIKFFFNEGVEAKSLELQQNVDEYIAKCKQENDCDECIYSYAVKNYDFQDIFSNQSILNVLNDKSLGKFILLDQYGFKQINDDIFEQLVSFPKTDFIFFISSSNIRRFKEHESVMKYIQTNKISFNEAEPKECHRQIADYYRSFIKKEYYIHHFTIKKGANYWGLIFGSGHTLGMEKFLKVCWNHDPLSGDANYNIDNNWEATSLFASLGENIKKDTISVELRGLILNGEISDNIIGLKYTMNRGCEPKLFTEVVKELEREKKIERLGDKRYSSTNIHRLKGKNEYQIKRINNGK